ncbi:signal recognition particle 9 kDa protein isoform X4 [Alligator sinensis]|uniref:Signal recognition particle 9 kDa protein n=1 Tax=Alligator sinensis TaxID=38654 RepID=A0A3Q0HNC6_ALLSI|nr:signal recognition particle 9 kDa protein isoform X4 [Alligator sinensis]
MSGSFLASDFRNTFENCILFVVRVVLKYRHCDGNLCIKVTDDVVCLLYRTDQAQDVKKIEKFHSQLMRLMVAKESRSAAMETD